MLVILARILTVTLAALLLWGAVSDVRSARIPNRVVLTGLVLALLAALVTAGLPGLGTALAAMLVAFLIGFGGFALGAIGGGDAKFLMVGAALVGLPQMIPYLLVTGAIGGALAVSYTVVRRTGLDAVVRTLDLGKHMLTFGRSGHRNRLAGGEADPLAVPYGVAIAAGALLVQFTPFAEWLTA